MAPFGLPGMLGLGDSPVEGLLSTPWLPQGLFMFHVPFGAVIGYGKSGPNFRVHWGLKDSRSPFEK